MVFDVERLDLLASDPEDRQRELEHQMERIEDRGLPEIQDVLDHAVHDPSPDVRWAACQLLKRVVELEDGDVAPAVVGALTRAALAQGDGLDEVRVAALEALAQARPSRGIRDALVSIAVEDPSDRVRSFAIDALARHGAYRRHPEVVRLFHGALGSAGRWRTTEAGALALGRVGDWAAVEALAARVRNREEGDDVRFAAARGLLGAARGGCVPGREMATVLIDILSHREAEGPWRSDLQTALGECGSPEAVEALARVAWDDNAGARDREVAVEALGRTDAGLQHLGKLVREKGAHAPAVAIEGLLSVALRDGRSSPQVVGILARLLADARAVAQDDSNRVVGPRALAIRALGMLRDPQVVTALVDIAVDPEQNASERGEALLALRRIGTPDALRAVRAVSSDRVVGGIATRLVREMDAGPEMPPSTATLTRGPLPNVDRGR